jgi:hypothetical protein
MNRMGSGEQWQMQVVVHVCKFSRLRLQHLTIELGLRDKR